jgi:D-lactate dehydrogenase (cytochrome)
MIGVGVGVTRCDLVDELTVRAVNAYVGTSFVEAPTLFFEFSGTAATTEADLETARDIVAGEDCTGLVIERSTEGRNRLWAARHRASEGIMASAPGMRKKSTDVTVPISRMPEAIRRTREALAPHNFVAAVLGHVGEGNYHVIFMFDPDRPEELAQAKRVDEEQVRFALEVGGTCSGEHGIGLGKISYLELEHADALPVMRAIKDALDPNGILNPGKVLPS